MFDRITSSSRIGSTLAVLGAVLMLLSVAAPAMAAAPVVDTETTDTSTTSDATDGATIATNFTANGTNVTYVEAEYDSTDPGINIVDPATGETITSYTEADLNQTFSNSTSSTYYYAKNISHDELSAVPMDSGENKSVELEFVDNTTLSEENQSVTNITVYVGNEDGRTVIYGGNTLAASNDFESKTDGFAFGGFSFSQDNISDVQKDNVAVNGTGSTVTFALSNSTVTGPFETAASDAEAGDFLTSQQAFVDGEPVPVYYQEVPDDANTSMTHGVYDGDTMTLNLGDEHEGKSAVDVHLVGNDAYSFTDRISIFGVFGALSTMSPLSLMGGSGFALFSAGLFITGRPEQSA